MENLFAELYCAFESLFGNNLAEYLWGFDCETNDYVGESTFGIFGFVAIGVALLFAILYYYLPCRFFNHPRSNRGLNWFLILFIVGLINGCFASYVTINDLLDGNIGTCLVEEGDGITETNCYLFGVANFIISSGFFFLWSLIFKWWSPNCKNSPF